eukprot:gene55397-biopygen11136
MFSPAGITTCENCGVSTYNSRLGAARCVPCTPGWVSRPGSRMCTACAAGRAPHEGSCRACSPGTFSARAATTCTHCPADTYANAGEGATLCLPCPTGETSPPGSISCMDTAPAPAPDTRVDPADGNAYTLSSFLEYYGEDDGRRRWDAAAPEVLLPPGTSFQIHYPLPTTHYSLLTTHYSSMQIPFPARLTRLGYSLLTRASRGK